MLDSFVYKKLAHNDTGAAPGHQGGIVIPKDIARFFPVLPALLPGNATVDTRLTADLFVDGSRLATVETRYQHQTWGGTRTAERRLTDNLGPLRNQASKDDILLFAKDLDVDGYIQLHLIRKGTADYARLDGVIGSSRWGLLDPKNPPVSVDDIRQAEDDLRIAIAGVPAVFGPPRAVTETTMMRKARDSVFRNALLDQYDHTCAFTGRSFRSPVSPQIIGLDAAHVVPVQFDGSDHPANGILLSKDMHWAFDRGLVGVSPNRTIVVPASVQALQGNGFLRSLNGTRIREAKSAQMMVLEEALDWHRRNVLVP
jgi:putative restriction endonuclease